MPETTVAQVDEQISETNTRTITISELPGRPINVILEFALFLTMMGLTLSSTAISNIVLYRSCVHSLHYSVEECRPFLSPERTNDTKHLEVEVQKYVTYVTTVKTIIESLGPAFLSLFLGVWSDTHGRKPLIVWPLFGLTWTSMSIVVFAMLDNLGPWWYTLTVIPISITGGFSGLFTGAFCYISDVSTSKNSSLRMTLMEIAVSAGSVVGSLACSHLLKAVGNVYMLLIAASIFVLAYAVTNVWLQESLVGAVPGTLSSVLDFLLIKEMVTECFKRRPNYLRAQILILTVANSLNVFILYGLSGLEYLYTREKLHWSLKDFNQFSAASVLISFVGSFLGVAVIQKYCKVSDLAFSAISFASSVGEYAIKTIAVASWHMYLASGVSSFGSLSAPLIRSFLTKILPVQDIAKVFALMCAIEGIFPLISPALYNAVYNLTIASFPGAILLMTSFVNAICLVMLLVVVYLRWKSPSVSYEPVNSVSAVAED
ncbi:probable peptidoglycan muropeptide transporter SLC46 isoform X1 [Amyelois transitella]|uniref:probable peptidoglycan muropeptide transporter SLC46 isoform X1 n=1 Tax=Amyelois transitella TaxID=680683 RepID=UPI0029902980|nr:probable peptidoglycan muropeptide transporter SLC46 isoform X1 [Amyelois transitella]